MPVAGIFAVVTVGFFGLRHWVNKETAKIRSTLDNCEYVLIEAAPEQLPGLREDFEGRGWRLSEIKPTNDNSELYRFEKVDGLASPLSQLLGFGEKRPKPSGTEPGSHFQMKIKAHGLRRDLNVTA